jgi:hypothetical protein
MKAKSPIKWSEFAGSMIRGAFGSALKSIVCPKRPVCVKCEYPDACVYGYIFETPISGKDLQLGDVKEAPRPYMLEGITEGSALFEPEDKFSFKIMLCGKAIKYLHYVIYAIIRMGERGLGAGRGKAELLTVEDAGPNPVVQPVFDIQDGHVSREFSTFSITEDNLHATSDSQGSITLNIITPLRIKFRGRLMKQPPIPFEALFSSLFRRTEVLNRYHGDGESMEANELHVLAKEIIIREADLFWQDWSRYSSRKGLMRMGGLSGRITYEGKLGPFIPWLEAGVWTHVGKSTTFGLGGYEIVAQKYRGNKKWIKQSQ